MSKPGTIYKIIHQAFDPSSDVQCITEIADYDNLIDDSLDPEIIELMGSGDPQNVSVIDNNEDPFTPILAQQQTLKFISANGVSMDTFASGSDDRWGVHSYIGDDTKTTFRGRLDLEGMREAFMPEGNEVTLTANDGLGNLKNKNLEDFDGNTPFGVSRIIDYLAWCLNGTGMSLQINCAFNIKNSTAVSDISVPGTTSQHFFHLNFLDAKTFEDTVGTTINMYDVIQYILREEAVIFQRQGMWWIVRRDEIESATRGLYISTFTSQGVFIENLGEIQFNKTIHKDTGTIFFSKEATEVVPARPLGTLKITYNYRTPLELPANVDFERGDLLTTVSPTEKRYAVDSWYMLENKANGQTPAVAVGSAYIKRTFDSVDYEDERYVVVEEGVGVHPQATLKSEPIYIDEGDKIRISVDFRLNADIGDLLVNAIAVELVADDGTYWYMLESGFWFQYPPLPWSQILALNYDTTGQDTSEWMTVSALSNEAPREGRLYIHLMQTAPSTSTEIYFDNLTFDYYAKVNGSHQKYIGQSQSVTQEGGYKSKRESTVQISTSPKRLFKGALLEFLQYVEIWNDTVIFVAPDIFKVSGDQRVLFQRYQRLSIQGTVSNNQFAVVRDVQYTIIGDETLITIWGTTVNETVTAQILEGTYRLATKYYNAAVFPSGPPDTSYEHPYSEIQVYDVWNQFRTEKRVFEATCQGIDLSEVVSSRVDQAHLIHKYFFTDASADTYNRIFTCLTLNQQYRTQEWTATFREIDKFDVAKSYVGRVFKYET